MKKSKFITQAALICALYTVLTLISGVFSLSSGPIQLRLGEALCILPAFTPSAICGLTLGCLISNILCGGIAADVVFGSIATLLGALFTYLLRNKNKYLLPIPNIISNTLIVPFVLSFAYGAPNSIFFLILTVFIGEVLSSYVFGMIFYRIFEKNRHIFRL